ncbi:hypothetical protein BU24DRAFT_428204 [Aaosphaeria arxii CBS 175.79]|uniref:CUE domain-containing protein n=1 Tax=Aaosphaeria arxii CBS 175.79 TaxID=1450172 RepID=A0A6A5XB41_9PLEO|nr:uncharacterized protein BU24DRAFT_428204 [Aaosphaeria arxii CBS 175.79]KAF2010182.1 hypothetical protein BU24DRAFT_428204 [Aaosphaeria arxii CBS 175.79]
MSEKPIPEKPTKTGAASGAESPTTARELDFDDDNEATTAGPETAVASPPPISKSPKPGVRFSEDATEIPPPKPPRPTSPQQQAENTLIEAFPSIDSKIVKAVLVASGGKVEPAFNALLSMSDPSFSAEDAPPPQPPRPAQQPRSQVEQDEIYARQLAQHYQSSYTEDHGSSRQREPHLPQQRQQTGLKPNELYDRDHSFFDDDLPVIRKNIEQGFKETQTKVNQWITNFKKQLDGEPDEYDQYGNPVSHRQVPQQRQNYGPSQSDQSRRSAERQRRSADRERYDTDNRVLGDDFEALQLRDDEAPQQRGNRPFANPNLFKPTPVSPPTGGPVDEVDALYRNPSPNGQQTGTTGNKSGNKKWQPLTSIAPNPEPDDHDPFSLGDSDEDEAKQKDIKAEDTERLKKAAEGKEGPTGQLKGAERSGSVGQKDAAAEALLKEAK